MDYEKAATEIVWQWWLENETICLHCIAPFVAIFRSLSDEMDCFIDIYAAATRRLQLVIRRHRDFFRGERFVEHLYEHFFCKLFDVYRCQKNVVWKYGKGEKKEERMVTDKQIIFSS